VKKICRTIILLFTVVILSLSCGIVCYAKSTAATRAENKKNYGIDDCVIKYYKTTGQVRVEWDDSLKENNKGVTLYFEGSEIASSVIHDSNWDITTYVQDFGTGSYKAEVFPVKLGEEFTKESKTLRIDSEKYEKICKFDPDLYLIVDPWWELNTTNGQAVGHWEEYEKVKGRSIKLKKGNTVVCKWKSSTNSSYDFTESIASSGSGTYVFYVCSKQLGYEYAIESDELEIDSETLKLMKKYVQDKKAAEEATRIGWYKNGPETWYYYKEYGVKSKSEWIIIDNKRYHFTSSGIMQTGWQAIDQKWYYFGTDGALVTSTVTPDGYYVNSTGARVDESGTEVTSKGSKQAPATMTTLKTCAISISESGKEAGVVKEATFKGGTGFTVTSYTMSKPYEKWVAGEPIQITADVETTANYTFSNEVKFTCRGSKNVSSTGGVNTRKVSFTYYPKMQLTQPEYFYVKEDSLLYWKPPKNAKRYKLTFIADDGTSNSEIIKTNYYDISSYLDDFMSATKVKIVAMADEKKTNYFSTSSAFEIENLLEFVENNQMQGDVVWSNAGMKYYNEDGELANGWYKLFGNWYYFKKNGFARSEGWFYDKEDNNWYYFDKENRMCTGSINDGTGDYFLNDGSNPNYPIGAWVER